MCFFTSSDVNILLESQVKTGRCSFQEGEGAASQVPRASWLLRSNGEGTWEPLPAVLLCPLCTVNPLLRLNKSTKNQKLQTNCCLSTVKISRSELSARWENGEQPAPLGAIKVFSALQTLQDLGTVSNKCRSSIFSVSCREGEVEGHSLKPQKLG